MPFCYIYNFFFLFVVCFETGWLWTCDPTTLDSQVIGMHHTTPRLETLHILIEIHLPGTFIHALLYFSLPKHKKILSNTWEPLCFTANDWESGLTSQNVEVEAQPLHYLVTVSKLLNLSVLHFAGLKKAENNGLSLKNVVIIKCFIYLQCSG